MSLKDNIAKGIASVTKTHHKAKKAIERSNRPCSYRDYYHESSYSLKAAFRDSLDEAVARVSSDGKYRFRIRMLYYQMRPTLQAMTDRKLTDVYFGQTLVKKWEEEHGPIPGLLRDPRGHFYSPHQGDIIPLGTADVEEYIIPSDEFQAVVYIEKEGFKEILDQSMTAQRFDVAFMLGKGYATQAAKDLLQAAYECGLKILVLHDCDRDGYQIARKIERQGIDVVNIGLTVADVTDLDLQTEPAGSEKQAWELYRHLDEQERQFLIEHDLRCELNAFTVEEFIAYLERKLTEQGLAEKLIPDGKTVADTFLRDAQDHLQIESEALANRILMSALSVDFPNLRQQAFDALKHGCRAPPAFRQEMVDALNDGDSKKRWWRHYVHDQTGDHIAILIKKMGDSVVRRLAQRLKSGGQ